MVSLVYPLVLLASMVVQGDDETGHEEQFDTLQDCTLEVSTAYEWDLPNVPDSVRKEALEKATTWARDNCFLPCDYPMCGSISAFDEKSVSVYVSYPVYECVGQPTQDEDGNLVSINICMGPEAEVTFGIPSFGILEEGTWHSGCNKDCYDSKGE